MPLFTTTVSSPIHDSFKVEQVRGMFDLPRSPVEKLIFTAELPDLNEPWTIGAIVGPSGSGKSTLARAAFGAAVHQPAEWPADRAVIDAFAGLPIKRVSQLLAAVGLGTPLAWLRPYHVLSGGEKFRCELARAIANEQAGLVVFDEFTSVVDRTVAKCASAALARLIRQWQRMRFVAVTCHYDILEWLAPDWHLDMATGRLARGSLQRKPIRLEVRRCRQSLWPLFARHHYLSGGLSRAATCYVALWDGRPGRPRSPRPQTDQPPRHATGLSRSRHRPPPRRASLRRPVQPRLPHQHRHQPPGRHQLLQLIPPVASPRPQTPRRYAAASGRKKRRRLDRERSGKF